MALIGISEDDNADTARRHAAKHGWTSVELLFDATRQYVEILARPRSQEEVHADREEALLAPLQTLPQPLSILECYFSLGVGDAFAA